MLRPLYYYCYDSMLPGCTILLVYVFGGLGLSEVYCSPPSMQHALLCNMSQAKSKSKPDNYKPKSSHPLTVYCTKVRGFPLILKHLMLKNNPDIFAQSETNLHGEIQDSDFELPGYFPIHRKDAGPMHGHGIYVKSNLPIAGETILVFVWHFYILLPSYFYCIVCHLHHLVLWLMLCHPI